MVSPNLLLAVALAYVALLFAVAFIADKQARRGRSGWLRSPVVYTLSLSIYCTAWTFYGAVGYAARSGLEFVTIYLGPTLVMVGWWSVVRKMVRIGRTQRITSIADLVSSRYGKSPLVAGIVTLMAVIGSTPYIALQLQSVTLAIGAFSGPAASPADPATTALAVAAGLAFFTVLFGTRNLDADERHDGVVTAIALEAVVKLVALLAVGGFVVWGIAGGPADIAARIDASALAAWRPDAGRWVGLTFLSAAAFLTLPRIFQVLVVENADERHLATASWAFPLYLFAMSLFVVPIAVVGLDVLPADANPDLFVLTLPLAFDRGGLAMLSFLGGFSSATSMVIVASIALATMLSNHVVLPVWLAARRGGAVMSGDVRTTVLRARRVSIAAILALGYLYYRVSGGGAALASIGLISFLGLAQILPALIGALYWRGATRPAAAAALVTGFAVWAWTLFLPSFGSGGLIPAGLLANGPWGIGWLRPQALLGVTGMDPLVHALVFSLGLNVAVFVAVSLATFPTPIERLQGAQFVNVFHRSGAPRGWSRGTAEAEDLLVMSQRLLGAAEAQALFRDEARGQGTDGFLPDVTPDFVERLERRLAGSVGAATAHAMIAQIGGGAAVTVGDLMAVADEAQQRIDHASQLEARTAELGRTARALREANAKLTALSVQKDAFLGQISHELRTPMTSIRAFSGILRDGDLTADDRARFSTIIHDQTVRLTRLLDDLLDLAVLENGQVRLARAETDLAAVIDAAVDAGAGAERPIAVIRDRAAEQVRLTTDPDRLTQVFVNLIANARKYCTAERPVLRIAVRRQDGAAVVDFIDNGPGIPAASQALIFEKFARLGDTAQAGGAGLGLAICREIMARLGGGIAYLPGQGGAAFRVTVPLAAALAAAG